MSKHCCPSFRVKVVWLDEKGAVVESVLENGTGGQEYFNLFRGAMGPKSSPEIARAEFAKLRLESQLEVTCQDPAHPEHPGPDGERRPHVSAWLAVQARQSVDTAEPMVAAAVKWDTAGGGRLKIERIEKRFVIARGPGFTGLWHDTLYGDFNPGVSAIGTDTPNLKLLEPPTVLHNRAKISLTRA